MDWNGTPVRDGPVSLTVPDRRPVGVFLQRAKVLQTKYYIERDSDESAGPLPFFFILKTPCLLQIHLTPFDAFKGQRISPYPLSKRWLLHGELS